MRGHYDRDKLNTLPEQGGSDARSVARLRSGRAARSRRNRQSVRRLAADAVTGADAAAADGQGHHPAVARGVRGV